MKHPRLISAATLVIFGFSIWLAWYSRVINEKVSMHEYPPSSFKYRCGTIRHDGTNLLNGPCTAWRQSLDRKITYMGRGQFENGARVGRWTFANGETGEFKQTGIRVSARYGRVTSTNALNAVSWHPDGVAIIPHSLRAAILHEQSQVVAKGIRRALSADSDLGVWAEAPYVRVDPLEYRLGFRTNCWQRYYIYRRPEDTNSPFLGIQFAIWLTDPLAPGDRELTQIDGPSTLEHVEQFERLSSREWHFVEIGRSFSVSAQCFSSSPETDEKVNEIFVNVIKALDEWCNNMRGEKASAERVKP